VVKVRRRNEAKASRTKHKLTEAQIAVHWKEEPPTSKCSVRNLTGSVGHTRWQPVYLNCHPIAPDAVDEAGFLRN